jgi:hypothetical protein
MSQVVDKSTLQESARHCFLQYVNLKPPTSDASKIAAYILNRYSGGNWSVSKYKKSRNLSISNKKTSEKWQIRFDDVVKHIIETRSFDAQEFHCTPLYCSWLDSVQIKHDIPRRKDATGTLQIQLPTPFPNFPLIPTLDGEGMLFTSFQTPVQRNILRLHRVLVEESFRIMETIQYLEWLNDMRMLLNECVSLVDITLHQLYFAAEYNLKTNWRFDPDKLGKRQGSRINDKFRWIGLITGSPLDNARDETASFNLVREIRNHFNHFDPPCVAISIDDAAEWLNHVPQIGKLLWKIRSKLDAQLTQELIEIMLLPTVKVNPRLSSLFRAEQAINAGYSSTTFKP